MSEAQITTLCPCNSGLNYPECCGVYHSGEKQASTAETLMRARYTAFAIQNKEYTIATWDNTTRPKKIDFPKSETQWNRLEIIEKKKGEENDSKGIVEFKAYYSLNDKQYVLNEISRFKKQQGYWYYLDGKVKSIAQPDQQTNLGKNTPCACGSGKKYKRCCGK
ncbi:YchJ family protein [Candidatus Nitrosacidococcus sp. I8]|uniref:YchJ family protein n=1 Tax=Candidatus Nitrosacidococcus sp. I8 TaxID=2942908 RepID=UPI0022267264|nr:YchJ family protein [Candidatus Nitrosacidococcus sp. I8]CAH9017794.1 hypothetical protein NURINAE_00557 [Candidatus Nitrosacidococcus sp. I8]